MADDPDGPVEPDYRFTLANERTALAWVRTSVGSAAAAIAVAHLADNAWGDVAAVLLACGGALFPVFALRQWRANDAAMRRNAPLPRMAALPLLVAVVATASIAVAAAVFAR